MCDNASVCKHVSFCLGSEPECSKDYCLEKIRKLITNCTQEVGKDKYIFTLMFSIISYNIVAILYIGHGEKNNGKLVTGVVKMMSSPSRISLIYIWIVLEESNSTYTLIVAIPVTGSKIVSKF